MEEIRYVMEGGDFFGKPAEIMVKNEPDKYCIKIFNEFYNAKKIKIYKAKLEFIEEIELGGEQE